MNLILSFPSLADRDKFLDRLHSRRDLSSRTYVSQNRPDIVLDALSKEQYTWLVSQPGKFTVHQDYQFKSAGA